MKGIAIVAIFIHHWFILIIPYSDLSMLYKIYNKLSGLGGTLVQLFFLLSGYGLYTSYYQKSNISWKTWAKRRVVKILLPYWTIVIVTYILAFFIPGISSHGPQYKYDGSIVGLLSYIFLFRNIYPNAWGLNVTFWFVPVIIGLYIIFPILLKILEKYGPKRLLFLALIINYTSITMFINFGLYFSTVNHQRDWFMFYIVQFVAGMLLAYYTLHQKIKLSKVNPFLFFASGIIFYGTSTIIKYLFVKGHFYNDIFTTLGAFFIIYGIYNIFKKYKLRPLSNFFNAFGQESYMIYLIHFPLIIIIREIISYASLSFMTYPSYMIFTCIFFSIIVLSLSKLISRSLKEFIFNPVINISRE